MNFNNPINIKSKVMLVTYKIKPGRNTSSIYEHKYRNPKY